MCEERAGNEMEATSAMLYGSLINCWLLLPNARRDESAPSSDDGIPDAHSSGSVRCDALSEKKPTSTAVDDDAGAN